MTTPPQCTKCQADITEGKIFVAAKKPYHPACFVCNFCGGPMTAGFFPIYEKFKCKACYEKTMQACDGCKNPIFPGTKVLKVLGKTYHEKCLVCTDCKAVLPYHHVYPVNNIVYCVECHYGRKIEFETANKNKVASTKQ